MGINHILPLIIGIAMTVILGSTIMPSYIEEMKIAKIENKTLANQELIKDSIVRYIKMGGKNSDGLDLEELKNLDLEELKDLGFLEDYHESNLFGGGYSFKIDMEKGILKISTTINDDSAGEYFSNSIKYKNAPTCVELDGDTCINGKWETFYLLDETTHDILKKIK